MPNTPHALSDFGNASRIDDRKRILARVLCRAGIGILRYGLVVILLWIGAMKFTAYEAAGIVPLVTHSPLMNWAFALLGERTFSNCLGIVEITLGLGIAIRKLAPRVSGLASLLAVGMFLTTLTFLITTPGWEATLGGFPALSALPGQFLLKDIVLLGAAVFTAGEAFTGISSVELTTGALYADSRSFGNDTDIFETSLPNPSSPPCCSDL
jgi:reactive chlorine resistance protein C